ncbi:MAG: T9SS type A sorting domain-containing protein [Balneolaceae bacterium]|nr:T9SS type A sorting domain-containing protein [Balneolaceae bacterium]
MNNLKTTIFKTLMAIMGLLLIGGTNAIAQQVELDFGGNISGRPGDSFTIEVTTSDLTDLSVKNFDFEFSFDASLVNVTADGIEAGGLVSDITKNVTNDDRILVQYASSDDIVGEGVLFTISGTFNGTGTNNSGISVTDYLIGDGSLTVTPSLPHDITVQVSETVVTLPIFDAELGSSFSQAIATDDLSALDIQSYDIEFTYNPDVVSFTGISTSGTASDGASAQFNTPQDGQAVLSVAFSEPIASSSGDLINLEGTVESTSTTSSELNFTKVEFFNSNGQSVAIAGVSGEVSVIDPVPVEATIAEARGMDEGSLVEVTGIVTTPDYGFGVNNFYIQDATGGIQTVGFNFGTNSDGNSPFASGQELTLIGEVGSYNSQLQIEIDSYTELSTDNTLPDPVKITDPASEWAVNSEFQGQRVTLENVVLEDESEWPTESISSGSGVNVNVLGNSPKLEGVTYVLRIDRGESYFDGTTAPADSFSITGVMGRFDATTQLYPFYEIEMGEATHIDEPNQPGVPEGFALNQNYPNPFNPTTNITYSVAEASDVTLKVYNSLGQYIATLVNSKQSAGDYTVRFDASNLSNGMYIVRIKAGSFVDSKKMLLLK